MTLLADQTIYFIEKRSENEWYIGTPNGLMLLDLESGSVETVREELDVRDIKVFKGAVYVAAYGKGLLRIDEEDDIAVSEEKQIVSVYAEDNQRLWFGTTRGELFSFDGKEITGPIAIGTENKPAAVWSITGDSADGLWLSTSRGLFFFKDGGVQLLLNELNVRQTLVVPGKEGRSKVWCAAEEGLYSLVFEDEFGWVSSSSDIDQGFASENMFSLSKVNDESLVIATNRGIVWKTLLETKPIISPSRILSRRIHLPSELKSGIILDFPQNTLTVQVTPISSRSFPEEFQYSFALYGPDGTLTKKRFSNEEEFLIDDLAPGTHRVKIVAFDRNLSSSDPLIFDIEVADAPFPIIATILAILLVIALAALIWAFFSQRRSFRTSRKLAVTNKELNSARLDLANEAERERKRIAQDLHDQTLADLRHLILMADDINATNASSFRTEVEDISDEIRRICEDLSPSVLENIGFTAAIEWELSTAIEQVSEEIQIETNFVADDNFDDQLEMSKAEEIQVYRIAQEVLSNIVRHAKPSYIEVRLSKDGEGTFSLLIRDNGSEFVQPESPKKESRGLTNINARAQLIKALIEWKRLDTDQTVFTLTKKRRE